MISILNEHYLITAILIIICFGIIYKFAIHLQFPNISQSISVLSILAIISTLIIAINEMNYSTVLFNSLFIKDNTTLFLEIITLFLSLGIIITTFTYNQKENIPQFEYITLILCVLISTHLLINVEELFAFYLILEFQSICLYILASLKKTKISIEGAIKYFILGSFSSIILLLGFSMLYGISGLTHFENLNLFFNNMQNEQSNKICIAIFLISMGLFFKVYMAPFHIWVSDIYAQSPNSSVILFATNSLLPFFFIFYKIYVNILYNYDWFWKYLIIITCMSSIIIGTLGALYQYSIKRLLAYSSITNVGYIFLSFLFYESPVLLSHGILYLLMYSINTFGIFSLINNIRFKLENGNEIILENIYQLQGFYRKNKIVSVFFLIYLYSIAGLPPFSFFFTKIYLFTSILYKSQYLWLMILIGIATIIAVFYYIRLIQFIYFNELKTNYALLKIPFSVSFINYIIILINCSFCINNTEITSIIQYITFQLYI